MIKGLYETHVYTTCLERSITFYRDVLGLSLAHVEEARRIAFFWIGESTEYMLGIWENPKEEFAARHFAFRCDTEFVLHQSVRWLKERNLQPYNFLKNGQEEPMVFAWMPALAIYFKDPDDNVLEFISILDGAARPELGVISWKKWEQLNKVGNK